MKLKIINIINDGVIACNKNNIMCFNESSLNDDEGEDPLYQTEAGVYVGQILKEKNHSGADLYWWYTRKQWTDINKNFENQ